MHEERHDAEDPIPPRTTRSAWRAFFLNTLTLLGALVFLSLLGETAAQIWYLFRGVTVVSDRELGFRPKGNLNLTLTATDAGGEKSLVRIRTNADGFRCYGDVASNKLKVFCIGDSYTFARHVAEDETYWGILRDSLDVEMFTFGAEGYACLQEYMALDKYLDQIRPDVVLWQFCRNDMISSTPELEAQSVINNNRRRRPYLMPTGEIEYMCVKPPAFLHDFANDYSDLAYFIVVHVDRVLDKRKTDTTIEKILEPDGADHPDFPAAVKVVDTVMSRAIQRCGTASFVAFDADAITPYYPVYQAACRRNGGSFVEGVGEAIDAAEVRKEVLRADDGAHWNRRGHRICADVLLAYFRVYPPARKNVGTR